MVGRTPWSARDALVPQPVQRYQHLAGCQQADGGVGRGPGGPPHQQHRRRYREKYVALANPGCSRLSGGVFPSLAKGAGIRADLKTFHQFGVRGEAVIALLTVQNTVRVSRVSRNFGSQLAFEMSSLYPL